MVFSSALFLFLFLPFFLLLYHAVPGSWRNMVTLLASLVFYAWGAPLFVFVIVFSTIIDFYIVRAIYTSHHIKRRKGLLLSSLTLNLGLLAYFKYANFFVENVNYLLTTIGISEVEWTSVALPIGISFYTFQTLTYALDVYRGQHVPLKRVTDYLLYIMSFPQMIAGPIVRFSTVADEIEDRTNSINDKLIGGFRFIIGLSKKVLIANTMGEQADLIFESDLHHLQAGNAWLGMVAYTFQIYFDFSGYSDMAIGLGRIIGFHFPENFNVPYTSRSITEFWKRWHMTLGSFMRDYLYIPMGGNKVDRVWKLYRNLMIVFLLSGLWHGASWNFVLWGLYHGVFLVLDRLFLQRWMHKIGTIPSVLITFVLVMFGWVVFRIEELTDIAAYFRGLFAFQSSWYSRPVAGFAFFFVIAVLFSFIRLFPRGEYLVSYFFERNSYSTLTYSGMWIVGILLLILSTAFLASAGFNPFIYFRF